LTSRPHRESKDPKRRPRRTLVGVRRARARERVSWLTGEDLLAAPRLVQERVRSFTSRRWWRSGALVIRHRRRAVGVVIDAVADPAGAASRKCSLIVVLLMSAVPVALPVMSRSAWLRGERTGEARRAGQASECRGGRATMDVLCVDKTGTITINQLAVTGVIRWSTRRNRCAVRRRLARSSQPGSDRPCVPAAAKNGHLRQPSRLRPSLFPV